LWMQGRTINLLLQQLRATNRKNDKSVANDE